MRKHKLLSVLMILVMMLCIIPGHSAVFAEDAVLIDSVSVTVTAPKAGTSSSSAGSLASASGTGTTNVSVYWKDHTGYSTDDGPFTFEEGRTYYAVISMNAESGYEFSKGESLPNLDIDANDYKFGGTVGVTGGELYGAGVKTSENRLRIWVKVTAEGAGSTVSKIEAVTLSFTVPKAGQNVGDAASSASVAPHCTVASLKFFSTQPDYDGMGFTTEEFTGAFEKDKTYYFLAIISPEEGYELMQGGGGYPNTKVTVNGADSVYDTDDLMIVNMMTEENKFIQWGWVIASFVPSSDHTVTFDTQGGTAVAAQTVADGGYAEKPSPDPVKEGFGGFQFWLTSAPSELDTYEKVQSSIFSFRNTPIIEDRTLYACYWGVLSVTVHDLGTDAGMHGGSFSYGSPYSLYVNENCLNTQSTQLGDTEVTLTAEPKDGFRFVGWSESKSADDIVSTDIEYVFTFKQSTTLYALFCDHGGDAEKLEKIEGRPADCENPGVETYWQCPLCKGMYSDAEGKNEISEPQKIEALGHDWGEWTVTKEATEQETGLRTRTCRRDSSHVETEVIPKIPAETVTYSNTGKGDYEKGSDKAPVFVFSRSADDDTTIDHFKGITVDGKEVGADSYTAEKGSVRITLKPEYLETLNKGEHTLTATFDDGDDVPVKKKKKKKETEESKTPETAAPVQPAATPKTGDTSDPAMMAAMLFISAGAVTVLAGVLRKRYSA